MNLTILFNERASLLATLADYTDQRSRTHLSSSRGYIIAQVIDTTERKLATNTTQLNNSGVIV
jgi:hypothetical protein